MAKTYLVLCYHSVSNEEALQEYAKLALPAVQGAGGRYLARGMPAKTYEAGLNQRTVIIEFDSVAQQLSISAGVTVAALVLETLRYSRSDATILVSDFQIAFLVVGAISLCCILFVLWLPKDAGSALTRRPPAVKEAAAEAAAETDRQI